MRIPINLSSEPFRRDRPMVAAYLACAIAFAGLLGLMIFLIHGERMSAKEARDSVARLSAEHNSIVAEQVRIDAFLRQPPNAEVLQRNLLLNTLIERKAISWTRIYADLESVLPYNVRLVSVRLPQITSKNEVVLDLVVGSKDPVAVIAFMHRLEESPKFGTIYGSSFQPPAQNEPLSRYNITVPYAQKL
ncbi:MAG TPA: hypothetical protein VKS01_03070 [Bryobacteraceae bacterium]|nr:hypothetical protein [Bryobacteraceae bacterium]